MERLTFEGNFCEIAKCLDTPGGTWCEDGHCSQRKVWERLKQYEDTGLTPEEIDSLPEAWMEKVKELGSGQLVRLPCKVGDLLWTVKWTGNRRTAVQVAVAQMWFTDDMRLIVKAKNCKQGEIGGSFFLTREDAEEALRRKEEERWT